jgi:pyruvate formate lyase activating enzyme
MKCRMVDQGFEMGNCLTYDGVNYKRACEVTLKKENNTIYRLIHSSAHKSPEQYLSIYQSGCNWGCRKCHSWTFSKQTSGNWMSPKDMANLARKYVEKNKDNLYLEPRDHATSWHAHDLCKGCGYCLLIGERSEYCPGKLKVDQITLLDDLTWGPARNIISFTGGDLACQPEFYIESAKKIKNLKMNLWVLFETNGYGLTPNTLEMFKDAGIDSFWLDIKAYDKKVHRKLTGVTNDSILKLPDEITKRGFVLEVSSLVIPDWVEADQIGKIAELLVKVDSNIPYAIIAFFPEYKMKETRIPKFQQMIEAFEAAKNAGLKNVRLGNLGMFIRNSDDYVTLRNMGVI